MSTVTALSGSNFPIRIGDNLLIGVRPSASSNSSSSSTQTTLSASQGAKVVSTALNNATAIYTTLGTLQGLLQKAANPATAPQDKAATDALSSQVASLKTQIDTLASGAKVGTSNLLSTTDAASVTVKTGSGLKVTVAAQGLDTTSLGLSGLNLTDASSIRTALAKVTQAVGQSQLAVFRLQTADGATSTASTATTPLDAVTKAVANQAAFNASSTTDTTSTTSTTSSTSTSLLSSVLANLKSSTTTGYSSSATSTTSYSPGSILNLFA